MLHKILFLRFHDFYEIRENRENRKNELIQDEEIDPGARLFVTTGNFPPCLRERRVHYHTLSH